VGEWTIVIQGHGIHDNGRDDDADAICQRFVDELARSQHIQHAQFTVGYRRSIPAGKQQEFLIGGQPASAFAVTPEGQMIPSG
jgi:hypothetical protein